MSLREIESIIEKVKSRHPYKVAGDYDTYGKYNEAWEDACDAISEALEDYQNSISQPEEEARGVQHQKAEKKKCEHRMRPFGARNDIGGGHYCVKCGYTI